MILKNSAKLIVVANSQHMKFFIKEQGERMKLLEEKSLLPHPTPEKHSSGHQSSVTQSHSLNPHTSSKDINNDRAARTIIDYLNTTTANNNHDQRGHHFKEIIITAEPQLLGHIRDHLDKRLKELIKIQLPKDFIHNSIDELQHAIDNAA
jgi:protein required for attachment to host cells